MNTIPHELKPSQLRRFCEVEVLDFSSTAEIPALEGIIGQERATRAIEFGIEIEADGYNIFAMGPSGAGKSSTILRYLEQKAQGRAAPRDWAYGRNHEDPYRPLAISFPPGQGRAATERVKELLRQADLALQNAFRGSLYAEAQQDLIDRMEARQGQLLQQLEQTANSHSFTLLRTPSGFTIAPLSEGKPLSLEEFNRLGNDVRQAYAQNQAIVEKAMEHALRALQEMQKDTEEQLRLLDREIAEASINPLFGVFRDGLADSPELDAYITAVESDILQRVVDNRLVFNGEEREDRGMGARAQGNAGPWTQDYDLNLLVAHETTKGAPVVYEINPTYSNLMGKVEYRAKFGALVPDHHTIRSGALHRANGGYLVVDARTLLSSPLAWESLKRALRYREIRIEEPVTAAGGLPAASLAPEPIPLQVKVVLIGDAGVYYDLYALDGSFAKLFKVRADFAGEMDWTQDNLMQMARFIRTRGDEEGLRPFSSEAVAEIVEYASRMVDSQKRLTTRFGHVTDIVRESDYWAQKEEQDIVQRDHVRQAVAERRYRANLYEEHLQRLITEDTLMIKTEGEIVGQVNALTVMMLGDYVFGRPSRITASTYLGNRGVINVERESNLSGNVHDKGVLILAGYLGMMYGRTYPLSLNASIAFEQSYDGVEGDSASLAELCAILSSLSSLPLNQALAVTGSINQRGDVQAVGGITAKVEGFFDVCSARGLHGDQGVILPAANVGDLMLRPDIIEAVVAGQFHVWPVQTVDEGFALLTGQPYGSRQATGAFSPDTYNARVDEALRGMAQIWARFARQDHRPWPEDSPDQKA